MRSDEITGEAGYRSSNDGSLEIGQTILSSTLVRDASKEKTVTMSSGETERRPICERRHLASTVALCTCTFIQAFLLISVFPYSGYMCIDLIPGLDEESAGLYAGLVASSFMLGRAFSSYPWGVFADRYGRKAALNLSLILSSLFSLLFGISSTFWCAIVMRFFLGFSNGIQGTAKTVVTELAYGNEKLETRGTGLVIGMRSYGFLISPAIGGILAEPLRQYPNSAIVAHFHPVLSRFPFILPNLVGALLCALAALSVAMFIEETLPREKKRDLRFIFHDVFICTSQKWRGCRRNTCCTDAVPDGTIYAETQSLLSSKQEATSNEEAQSISPESTPVSMSSIWKRTNTREHLLAYWIFSFVVVCVDEAFPLFCISKEGGLALSEASIGKILSTAGLLFVLGQYCAFATLVNKLGLYPSLTIGTMLGVPVVAFIPLSILFNIGVADGELTWVTFVFLSIVMAVSKIFSCLFFAGITMATNRTVPTSYRATTNGLAMLGGSITKGLGPVFAGFLVSFSMSSGVIDPKYGSLVIFSVIGLLGLTVVAEIAALSGSSRKE